MDVLTRNGMKRKVNVTIGNNIRDPPMSRIITTRHGEKVGYLYLQSFTASQFNNIEKHFLKFKRAGVSNLVLDLRYIRLSENFVYDVLAHFSVHDVVALKRQ